MRRVGSAIAVAFGLLGGLGLGACGVLGPRKSAEPPPPPPITAIESLRVHPGTCDQPGPEGEGFAFQDEPFAIHVEIRADEPAPSRVLRLAAGIDPRGVRDRIVTFDGSEVGVFVACVDGFELDWPHLASLRAELFEASRWLQTSEREFAVVPRDHSDTVVYPRSSHATRRHGTPVRQGDFLRLDASVFVANGTDEPLVLDGVVSGMVHDGTRAQSWAIRLEDPIKVEPYAISAVHNFHLAYPLSTGLGQRLYNDSLQMLVSAVRGTTPSPTTEMRSLTWANLPGIAVDVVFIGDFTWEKRKRAAQAVIEGAGAYLEVGGVTINRALSRDYLASELGIAPAIAERFTRIDDEAEAALLAAYQPTKSIERLTVYVVEDMWTPRGHRGAFRGGGEASNDPKTPFRTPVLEMPADLGPGGFHSGYQAFAQIAAQRIAEAMVGLEEVDQTRCRDINPFLPGNAFNLMSASSGAYSWVLSPCQREVLGKAPSLYIY